MRWWSVGLSYLLILHLVIAPVSAQEPGPLKLNLVIVEGDGAINNIQERTARERIVQVEDENHRPIAGAAVMFSLPNNGASGVFANGSRSMTVLTDSQGRAVARGLLPQGSVPQPEPTSDGLALRPEFVGDAFDRRSGGTQSSGLLVSRLSACPGGRAGRFHAGCLWRNRRWPG